MVMWRKIVWLVVIVFFAFQFSLVIIVWRQNRPIPHRPLLLQQVAWKFPNDVFYLWVADLDADGIDELVMGDIKGHYWWAEWTGKPPRFEPIPVPTVPISSRVLIYSWQRSGQLIVDKIGKRIRLITRSGDQWCSKFITALDAVVGDLDGDGQRNDALLLITPKKIEWWQRTKDGRFVCRDQLTLPRPFNGLVDESYGSWFRWRLHGLKSNGFFCIENGRLCWKGAFANDLEWFEWKNTDLDGDSKDDHLEFWRRSNKQCELVIKFANGKFQMIKLPLLSYATFVTDLDGDGRSEILLMEGPRESLRLRLFRFDLKQQKFLEWVSPTINLMLVGEELFYSLLQHPYKPSWALFLTVKQGNRWQVERWWVSGKGWQSELVAVLPKVVSSKGDRVMEGWSVYQIGKVLLLVERRERPEWWRKFQELFCDLCSEIGLNVSFGECQTPHRRLWFWDEKKRRWFVLGYVLPDIAREDVFREWIEPINLGSAEEFGILWWSSPLTAHIGRFFDGVWQVSNLNVPLQFPVTLWDGERYWVIFYCEPIDISVMSKRWIAVTLSSHSTEDGL
jgi:hypothetical protein